MAEISQTLFPGIVLGSLVQLSLRDEVHFEKALQRDVVAMGSGRCGAI